MGRSELISECLSNLNPQQLKAVEHFEGPILVLAGAGSGKTRVLTRRIAHLILAHRVSPDEILAVTFTNKAAKEMQDRVLKLLGPGIKSAWISTFHSVGLRFLRIHANLLDYTRDFAIYDDQDSKNLIKRTLKELEIDEKYYPVYDFARAIDKAKNNNVLPEEFLTASENLGIRPEAAEMYAKVYCAYQKSLRKSNAMDFGDLIMNMVQLLGRDDRLRDMYRRKFRFMLVDEFQDTNYIQYLFIRLITAQHKNLLVVGDDDQSIYAFRGATINNILEFEKDYPETKIIKLEQNYRSTGNILKAAHAVIEKNRSRKDKKLWTEDKDGSPLIAFCEWDEEGEANFIAAEILKHLDQGYTGDQIAVFYRTNAQSRALEEALLNFGIQYRIYGGLRFYDRKEIKDILAFLKLLLNESDSQSFLRIINTPARGIGAQTIKSILSSYEAENLSLISACEKVGQRNKQVAAFLEMYSGLKAGIQSSTLSALIENVIERSEYGPFLRASKDPNSLSRLENLTELKALARSMDNFSGDNYENLRHFLDRTSLASSADLPEEDHGQQKGYVSLMTLHLAKGLEFPLVFLSGLEEGLIPHHRSIIEGDIEEERRLCYVGMTRAMKLLYVTRAKRRGLFNSGENFGGFGSYRRVSRFAYDIPEACIQDEAGNFFGRDTYLEFDEEIEVAPGGAEEDDSSAEDEAFPSLRKFRQKKKRKSDRNFKITTADDL